MKIANINKSVVLISILTSLSLVSCSKAAQFGSNKSYFTDPGSLGVTAKRCFIHGAIFKPRRTMPKDITPKSIIIGIFIGPNGEMVRKIPDLSSSIGKEIKRRAENETTENLHEYIKQEWGNIPFVEEVRIQNKIPSVEREVNGATIEERSLLNIETSEYSKITVMLLNRDLYFRENAFHFVDLPISRRYLSPFYNDMYAVDNHVATITYYKNSKQIKDDHCPYGLNIKTYSKHTASNGNEYVTDLIIDPVILNDGSEHP
jgi:hypothetical protein